MLTAALASLVVLALPQRTEAFYLPGVAPYEYKDSEKVRVPLKSAHYVLQCSAACASNNLGREHNQGSTGAALVRGATPALLRRLRMLVTAR